MCCKYTRIQSLLALALFYPSNLLPLTERNFPVRTFVGYVSLILIVQRDPRGDQQTFRENRFLMGRVAMVLGSRAWNHRLLRVFRAAGSQFESSRKHLVSRFWPSTTVVWRTRHPHTPHQERAPQFRGLWLLWGVVAIRTSSLKVQLGAVFVWFVYPKFRPILTTAAPQCRGVGLCGESADGQSEENHKLLWMNR